MWVTNHGRVLLIGFIEHHLCTRLTSRCITRKVFSRSSRTQMLGIGTGRGKFALLFPWLTAPVLAGRRLTLSLSLSLSRFSNGYFPKDSLLPVPLGARRLQPRDKKFFFALDGHLASLSWYRAPIWGSWPDFNYCRTFAVVLLSPPPDVSAFPVLSIAAPRPAELVTMPYGLIRDSVPFLSPLTTRKDIMKIFWPASTRGPRDRVTDYDSYNFNTDRIESTTSNVPLFLHAFPLPSTRSPTGIVIG
jgi:hypothetical protein